jgi:hypothetical protein
MVGVNRYNIIVFTVVHIKHIYFLSDILFQLVKVRTKII